LRYEIQPKNQEFFRFGQSIEITKGVRGDDHNLLKVSEDFE
jgi:hypothetical protein